MSIDKLLAQLDRSVTVIVGGAELPLRTPTAAAALQARVLMAEAAGADPVEQVKLGQQATIEAIVVCLDIRGSAEKRKLLAERAYLASGPDGGELSRTAWELCGLAAEPDADDRPTN